MFRSVSRAPDECSGQTFRPSRCRFLRVESRHHDVLADQWQDPATRSSERACIVPFASVPVAVTRCATGDTEDRVDDRNKVSSFFQVQAKVPQIDDQQIDPEIEPNSEDANDLGSWLGGRDRLNPELDVDWRVFAFSRLTDRLTAPSRARCRGPSSRHAFRGPAPISPQRGCSRTSRRRIGPCAGR